MTWCSNKTKLNPPLFPLYCFILMTIKMLQNNESYHFIFCMLNITCFLQQQTRLRGSSYIFLVFEKDAWEVWFWNFFHVLRKAVAESSWTQTLRSTSASLVLSCYLQRQNKILFFLVLLLIEDPLALNRNFNDRESSIRKYEPLSSAFSCKGTRMIVFFFFTNV